jgi:outer membrane protein W
MRRLTLIAGFIVLVVGFLPSTAHAQQTLTFSVGGFIPKGEDARLRSNNGNGDVLVNNQDFLAFNIKDFNGVTANVDYTTALGHFFDAGLGVGIYRRTVPSVYWDVVNANGSEIRQDLRLRIVPFTATIRFLPLGHNHGIEPFIGAGLGVFNWRYSEFGQFVATDNSIFRDSFVGSGTATGPVVLGGIKIPIGPLGFGTEIRYQSAHGDLPASEEFSSDRIDLGGWTYLATFHVRF